MAQTIWNQIREFIEENDGAFAANCLEYNWDVTIMWENDNGSHKAVGNGDNFATAIRKAWRNVV